MQNIPHLFIYSVPKELCPITHIHREVEGIIQSGSPDKAILLVFYRLTWGSTLTATAIHSSTIYRGPCNFEFIFKFDDLINLVTEFGNKNFVNLSACVNDVILYPVFSYPKLTCIVYDSV